MKQTNYKFFNKVDTVQGTCENCSENTILIAVVSEFYRCTNCGADTKQHINGRIRYLELTDKDIQCLKDQHTD